MATSKPTSPAAEEKAEAPAEPAKATVQLRTFGMVDRFEDGDIVVDREQGELPASDVDAFIRKAGMLGVHVMVKED